MTLLQGKRISFIKSVWQEMTADIIGYGKEREHKSLFMVE